MDRSYLVAGVRTTPKGVVFRWISPGLTWLCKDGDINSDDTLNAESAALGPKLDAAGGNAFGKRLMGGWDAFGMVVLVAWAVLLTSKGAVAAYGTLACGEAETGNAPPLAKYAALEGLLAADCASKDPVKEWLIPLL